MILIGYLKCLLLQVLLIQVKPFLLGSWENTRVARKPLRCCAICGLLEPVLSRALRFRRARAVRFWVRDCIYTCVTARMRSCFKTRKRIGLQWHRLVFLIMEKDYFGKIGIMRTVIGKIPPSFSPTHPLPLHPPHPHPTHQSSDKSSVFTEGDIIVSVDTTNKSGKILSLA